MTTNLALAKALADFADALADYNHLPALANASVSMRGKVFARLKAVDDPRVSIRHVALWADTFRQPVTFDLTIAGNAGVSTVVEIGARTVDVSAVIARGALREIELECSLERVPSGEVRQVPAAQLVAALDSKAVA